MTVCLNLIPDARQQARACKRWIRHWIVAAAVYGLLLCVACGLMRVTANERDSDTASEMTQIQARIGTVRDSVSNLQSRLRQHEQTLTANRDLIEHPDWGLLLGLLAKSLGDELVLRSCAIQAAASPGRNVEKRPDSGTLTNHYQLVVRGMGRTQAAVSELVLRLEQYGLFSEVKLVDTTLEPFLSGKSVAFHLECRLGGGNR